MSGKLDIRLGEIVSNAEQSEAFAFCKSASEAVVREAVFVVHFFADPPQRRRIGAEFLAEPTHDLLDLAVKGATSRSFACARRLEAVGKCVSRDFGDETGE